MNKNLLKFLVISSFLSNQAIACENDCHQKNKYRFDITATQRLSTDSASDAGISLIEGYRYLDDKIIENYDNLPVKIALSFVRYGVSRYIHVGVHELGGHGARLSDLKIPIEKYKISMFNGGYVESRMPKKISENNLAEIAAIKTGGMQASHITGEKIKSRFITSGKINPTYAPAYILMQNDQPSYIQNTQSSRAGDDIQNYMKSVNKIYGKNYMTKAKLRTAANIDYLDPFLYFSAYSFFTSSEFEIPMFDFGGVKYLPAARSVLAPYGLETRFINHFKYDEKYIKFSMSYGKHEMFKTYSAGLFIDEIFKKGKFAIGIESAIWSQPKQANITKFTKKTQTGGMIEINSSYRLKDQLSSLISFGHKTDGFIEGRAIAKSSWIRAGLRFEI